MPSITITAPLASSTVAGTVSINYDTTGVMASVTFTVDGQPLKVLPWDTFTTTNGAKVLVAIGHDNLGQLYTSAIPVVVAN